MLGGARGRTAAGDSLAEAIEEDVDDGCGVEGEDLAEEQAADHGDAERAAQLGAEAAAQGQRQSAEQRRHGGHHDGAEAQQAGFEDGLGGILAVLALGFEGEVDDHDAVLLDDADEQNDADDGDDTEVLVEEHEREQRADTGRGERGENGNGVDEALVENAEHDVDGDQRGENEEGFIGERVAEGGGGSLERGLQAGREMQLVGGLVDVGDGGAE